MGDPVLPVINAGPAIVTLDSYSYYTEGGIELNPDRKSFTVKSDTDGDIDERHSSLINEITFTPVGEVESLSKPFPYGAASVGKSIFGTSNKPVVIVTKFGGASNTGQTITFPRGAVNPEKMPQLRLSTQKTLLGQMGILCLGSAVVQDNTSAFWSTLADAVFADTGFDETKVVTDIYTAAWGASPFASMGALEGFTVDIKGKNKMIMDDGVGIADVHLVSLNASARFRPNNLTEANLRTLLAYQDTAAIRPGQSYANRNRDLVITGAGNNGLTLTVTLPKVGPKDAKFLYKAGEHRNGEVVFTQKRTATTGVMNDPFTLAIS
jgi:hypothetical protein